MGGFSDVLLGGAVDSFCVGVVAGIVIGGGGAIDWMLGVIIVKFRCGGGQKGVRYGRGTGGRAMGMAGLMYLGSHISVAHGGSNHADLCILRSSWDFLWRFLPCMWSLLGPWSCRNSTTASGVL